MLGPCRPTLPKRLKWNMQLFYLFIINCHYSNAQSRIFIILLGKARIVWVGNLDIKKTQVFLRVFVRFPSVWNTAGIKLIYLSIVTHLKTLQFIWLPFVISTFSNYSIYNNTAPALLSQCITGFRFSSLATEVTFGTTMFKQSTGSNRFAWRWQLMECCCWYGWQVDTETWCELVCFN